MNNKTSLRGPSDTIMFTVLYWISFYFTVIGLGVFAGERIAAVKRRSFVYDTNPISFDSQGSYVPDIIFCTDNAKLTDNNLRYFYNKTISLDGSLAPSSNRAHSLCAGGNTMMIVLFAKKLESGNMNTEGQIESIVLETNSTEYIQYTLLPSDINPFRQTLVPDAELDPQVVANMGLRNTYYAKPNETTAFITVVPEIIQSPRKDFVGLFNLYGDEEEHQLSSNVDTFHTPGLTLFQFTVPNAAVMKKKVLVMTIQDGLASWGGAFSLSICVFHFLFGIGRISPFGFIQKYLLRTSTRKRVLSTYEKQGTDKDSSTDDDEELDKPSFSSLQGNESDEQNGGHYNNHEQSANHEVIEMSLVVDNPIRPTTRGQATEPTADLRQQLELQKEELASLRAFVQKRDQQYQDLVTLLKDLFLDMELVDMWNAGRDDPKSAASSTSNTSASNTEPSSNDVTQSKALVPRRWYKPGNASGSKKDRDHKDRGNRLMICIKA
ncbi:hypothetical protein BGX31_005656 [Mortierella sp. GBA43]|nr:hypothetical protein BGX31_005656 [Mortierella sp. GBA43]